MLLRARWVLPITSDPIEDGAVVVRGGRIHDIGPHRLIASAHPGERVRDLGEAILMPGLINAHAHLELTLLRGFLDDLPFYPWLRKLVALKADTLKADEYVYYSLLGAMEAIRAGTTCIADCTDTGASFDALALSGLRGVVYQEAFGQAPSLVPGALDALSQRLDALQAMTTDRVRPGLSPHSPYLACVPMLEGCARIAEDRGLPLSIHLAESRAEDEYVRDGAGPFAELHAGRGYPVVATRRSPVEHVQQVGLLSLKSHVQFVHVARASQADLDILARAWSEGARIGLAACPRSNAKLGNGAPDLLGWLARGLPWGLGTDSAAAVGRCDLFVEMRHALLRLRATSEDALSADARSILARTTIEAARALGMDEEIGSLEKGKLADMTALSIASARCMPTYDPHSTAVQCADPSDVILTMVGGEVIFDGQEIFTVDEPRILARCRERATVLAAALRGRHVR